MLLGRTDSAIKKINNFFDFNINKVTEFDINATLRQLEIYIHFTKDTNAIKFYENLQTSWEALKKTN